MYAQDVYVLSGIILNSVSNLPLEGVLIRVKSDQNRYTYTNNLGFFSLELTSRIAFDIEVSTKGFTSHSPSEK